MAEDTVPHLTLPEVVVRPDDNLPPPGSITNLIPGGALTPPAVPAHDALAAARLNGHDWSDIHGYYSDVGQTAIANGATQDEVDEHFGWPGSQPMRDLARANALDYAAQTDKAPDAVFKMEPEEAAKELFPDTARQDYAQALITGTAKNATDFARSVVGAHAELMADDNGAVSGDVKSQASKIAQSLAEQLPSHNDAIDAAIALTADAGLPILPDTIANTKANLLEYWAQHGGTLADAMHDAHDNPDLQDRFTLPKMTHDIPMTDHLANIWDAMKEGAEAPFQPSDINKALQGIYDYYDKNRSPLSFINLPVTGAITTAESAVETGVIDAPMAVYMGAAAGGLQLLHEIIGDHSMPEDRAEEIAGWLNDYVLPMSMVMPGMKVAAPELESAAAVLAKLKQTKELKPVRVFDPMKEPGSAEKWVDAKEAYPQPPEPKVIPENETPEARKARVTAEKEEQEKITTDQEAALAVWRQLASPMMYGGMDVREAWKGLQRWVMGKEWEVKHAYSLEVRDLQSASNIARQAQRDRRMAQAMKQVDKYRKQLNAHMPEYLRWLKQGSSRLNDPDHKPIVAKFLDHVEGRSAGVTLDPKSGLAPLADVLRKMSEEIRNEIGKTGVNMSSFIEDYYRHLWMDGGKVGALFPDAPTEVRRGGRQGSSASLRSRARDKETGQMTVPTISQGLEKGLMPKIPDPIENTLHYMDGMLKFLASRQMMEDMKKNGYGNWAAKSPNTEAGWVPLKGWAAQRILKNSPEGIAAKTLKNARAGSEEPGKGVFTSKNEFFWAHPEAARIYNNYLGRGFYDTDFNPKGKAAYHIIQTANSFYTGMRLAWWGFHMMHIAQETAIASMSNGIGEMMRGEVLRGLKDMGFGATMAPAMVSAMRAGRSFREKYYSTDDKNPVVNALVNGGIRPTGRQERYAGAAPGMLDTDLLARGGNFYTLLKRGTLGSTLSNNFKAIWGGIHPETEGAVLKGLKAPGRLASAVVNEFERGLDTLNHFPFDYVIPNIKAGVASNEMEAWLRKNPNTSVSEQAAMGRKIVRRVDDTFGEFNQDNLHWSRIIKQMLNMATISIGWEYGTIHAFGRGIGDLTQGKLTSPLARWLIAFPMIVSLQSSLYQWLHTGTTPLDEPTWGEAATDAFAPLTGGTVNVGGEPSAQRAVSPGYPKDVLGTIKSFRNASNNMDVVTNLVNQGVGKATPLIQQTVDTFRQQDNVGHHIFDLPPNPDPGPFNAESWDLPTDVAQAINHLKDGLNPITLENFRNKKEGSNIPWWETMLGYREAPGYFENPEAVRRRQEFYHRAEAKKERKRDERESQELANPYLP
jgi:hypothetical protein